MFMGWALSWGTGLHIVLRDPPFVTETSPIVPPNRGTIRGDATACRAPDVPTYPRPDQVQAMLEATRGQTERAAPRRTF